MAMVTVQEIADRWKVSVRYVQSLCQQGRIPGAERRGRDWMIPENTSRPTDRRTKAGQKEKAYVPEWEMPKRTPLLFTSDLYRVPGTAQQCLDRLSGQPEAAALFEAWLRFCQGDAESAVELARPLISRTSGFYGTLGVGCLLCACALWLGDMALFRTGREHMLNVPCEDPQKAEIRDYWISVNDAGLLDGFSYVDWPQLNVFDRIPEDSVPAVCFYYAKYIHRTAKNLARGIIRFPDIERLGLCRVYPYMVEPIIARVQHIGCVQAELLIRLLCADIYYSLNDRENAVRHLDAALALAVPDRLYGAIAEFRVLYSDLFDERLALLDENAVREVKELQKKIAMNFTKMKDRPPTALLTDREYEIAQFAALGMTNATIAKRLHLSQHTVKKAVSAVMDKLAVKKRSEIGLHIF